MNRILAHKIPLKVALNLELVKINYSGFTLWQHFFFASDGRYKSLMNTEN